MSSRPIALAALLLALVPSAAQATHTRTNHLASGTSSSGARAVTLVLHGQIVGPSSIAGTWQATGAINDSGTYTETFHFSRDGSQVRVGKVLVGSAGTIVLQAHAGVVDVSPTLREFRGGAWSIVLGTGAYAGLHAGGRPAATPDSFADLASGEVVITHEGFVRD
jgi:hypothetical protein